MNCDCTNIEAVWFLFSVRFTCSNNYLIKRIRILGPLANLLTYSKQPYCSQTVENHSHCVLCRGAVDTQQTEKKRTFSNC